MSGDGTALSAASRPRDGLDFHFETISNLVGRGLERFLSPRSDHEVHAFARERHRAALAEALGRRAHERGLAANSQIHALAPFE
jgi:hypothetical protein